MAKKTLKRKPVATKHTKSAITTSAPIVYPAPAPLSEKIENYIISEPTTDNLLKYSIANNRFQVPVQIPYAKQVPYGQELNDDVLLRQIYAESAFNPNAVSSAGYKGLGQIGKDVIEEYKKATGVKNVDPFNINDNLAVQKWAMTNLYNADFINKPDQDPEIRLAKALAGYNWGRGHLSDYLSEQKKKGVDIYNSKDWMNDLPTETREYIEKILYKSNDRFNDEFKKAIGNNKYKNITERFIYDPNKVVINDNMGQWAHPGEVTRIASNDITMQGVPYPVLGVGADGEQQMMYPNEEYAFNEAPVTEYPMMEAKDGGWLSKYQDGGWQPNQEDLRADGTQKGTGYLGVLNRPDGGVSSELSMGVEIDGKEVQIPTMVPTLNPEEINYLLNTPTDEDLMRTEIGKRIMDKAYNHAMMRMDQGLSPFYQEGEERQDTGVPLKQNIFNTKYKRGGVTWLNEYANGGFNLTSPEYAEYEYLQSLNQPVTVVRQPAVGQYQMAQQVNDPSYSNRAYSNKTAVQSAKNAIEAAMPKQITIDFSQAAVIEEPKEIIVKPTTTSTISTDESQANKVSDKLMSAFQKSTDEYKQKYPNRPSPVISSGFRSHEKQAQLYANRGNNPYPVAKPGTSKHEHGLAIDVGFTGAHTDQDYANFAAIMNKNGVNWLGARDKVHFELNESAYGGWLDQYAQGGKTFSAGGEKHKVYRKESPTGNGEGVKGHIMVTHPTMDKGEWDTIDLTEKSGARTVAEGIAATRKWHEENPEYANGGGVNLNSPQYAEYQYLQSLNTPTPVYRQPAVETVQIPNTQLQYNTPYNYQRTVDTSYAKDVIQKAMPKQIEIDFGAAAEPVITPSEQKATKEKSESVASTENLSMEEGTRRAYSAIVRELENDPATKDRAKDIAKMVMAQAAFETGNWRNAAALQANNYSGIKFYGQKGKKPSEVLAPGEEENGYRRPYVQYDSPEDWASGMVELLKGRYKKALETTTPEEYAARLKERGYYGGKESDYAKGLRYYLNNLKFEDKAEHGGWLSKYEKAGQVNLMGAMAPELNTAIQRAAGVTYQPTTPQRPIVGSFADNTKTYVQPALTKEQRNAIAQKKLAASTAEHIDFFKDQNGSTVRDAQGNPIYNPAKGTTYGDNGTVVAGALLAGPVLKTAGALMDIGLPYVGNVGNALTYAAMPQAAWNAAQGDYTDAALLATPYLFKGLKAAPSVLKNAKQEFIYNAIDPLGYGAVDKLKRMPSTFFQNVTDAAGRPYRIGTNFDSQLMDNVEKASVLGKNRLDAWRVGLQLPQKYGTFTKVGPDTYTINNFKGLDPKALSGLWNDVRAHEFNSSNSMYQGEHPLVRLSEDYERFSSPTVEGKLGPWQQGRIVENAKDPNFQWSVYDNDATNGIMGGYRWDVNKTPTGQLQFKYNDTWDLHPWATRGQTVMVDPNDAWAVNFHNHNRSKDVFKPFQNVEALRLLGGKPFNIQGEFLIDPKTMKILNNYQGLSQHKNGGWLNKYK